MEIMAKFFFSGSVATKLDDKGRFVLPQEMRYGLVENGAMEFSMGLGLGGCLAIYRRSEMEKMVQKFQAKQYVAEFQKFFTFFFSTLYHTSCDKIGRVHIPPMLKNAANLENKIVIAGVLNRIEIWSERSYEANLSAMLEGHQVEGGMAKLFEKAFALLEEPVSKEVASNSALEDDYNAPATVHTLAGAAKNMMEGNRS